LRVWQVEAGQVLWIINFNPAVRVDIKEQLQVIADADLETDWDFRDIHVPGITVVVAVGNAESELTSTQRVAVVNGEESGWPTRRAACSNGRSLIAWIIGPSRSLC
jgi:hypothetical protein